MFPPHPFESTADYLARSGPFLSFVADFAAPRTRSHANGHHRSLADPPGRPITSEIAYMPPRTLRSSIAPPLTAALALLLCSCAAQAQLVDHRVPLSYNFHGMCHPGECPPTTQTPRPTARTPTAPSPIAASSTTPPTSTPSPRTPASPSRTGISYAFYDTLGPSSNPGGSDIVHLGSRCSGFDPASIAPYEAAVNTGTSTGIAPSWNVCNQVGTPGVSPQTSTFGPGIVLDPGTETGILYHGSNGGGAFNVVLGFSDGSSLPRSPSPAPTGSASPPIPRSSPASPSPASRSSATPRPAPPTSPSKCAEHRRPAHRDLEHLQRRPQPQRHGGRHQRPHDRRRKRNLGRPPRGSRQDPELHHLPRRRQLPHLFLRRRSRLRRLRRHRPHRPARQCELRSPQVASAGDTIASNARTFGAAPSTCGTNDSSAVWFQYTATGTHAIDARTCGGVTNFDTTLSVYTSCGSNPIACSDNNCGFGSLVQ